MIHDEMRNALSAGKNTMGITQDPIISIGDTLLFRGLAARRFPLLDGFIIDCSPRRLVSTVFMKTSDV